MSERLDDEQIQTRIEELEKQEAQLRHEETDAADAARDDKLAEDSQKLEAIRVELDRLWDYLRQRRALRDAGQNPDDAQMRDSWTVERYWG
jgi:hypothetical protein